MENDLGLAESILYNWRAKRRQTVQPFEDQKLQQAEIARLKRENSRLEEDFTAHAPDQKWVSDLTYKGWLYLAVVPEL